jgi:phospholipid transport system substrate-binding protein
VTNKKRMIGMGAVALSLLLPLSAAPAWADAAAVAATAATSSATSPQGTIAALDNALLEAMKGGKALGYAGRYRIVSPVVKQLFDFEKIASLTMGPYWAQLHGAQQKEFMTVLADYTAATYAARFDRYDGERFAITSSQMLQPGTMGVFTTFTEHNGKVHRFDYLLQQADQQWRIVNVVADGVSDLSMKRAEYTDTMKSKGFQALVAHLRKQIDGYAREGGQ